MLFRSLKKQEISQINNLTLHLKQLEKEEQKIPFVSSINKTITVASYVRSMTLLSLNFIIDPSSHWVLVSASKTPPFNFSFPDQTTCPGCTPRLFLNIPLEHPVGGSSSPRKGSLLPWSFCFHLELLPQKFPSGTRRMPVTCADYHRPR